MDVSIIVPTYNRCTTLNKALSRLAAQIVGEVQYEIIIVNNNSTDATSQVAQSFIENDKRFRYIFESRQGLSYARNAGIEAAGADLIVFTDDDVEVADNWIQKIHEAALQYPDAEFFGGKVLPLFDKPMPDWAHLRMAPFALQERGNEPFRISREHPCVLIGASLIVRRRALKRAGLFRTETQRVKKGVGSTEDADWETNVWSYSGYAMYVPNIVCYTDIPTDRLVKSYHRTWHLGHGKFNAKARRPEWEGSRRLLDVPAFMYRQTIEAGIEFLRFLFKRRRAEAFERECNLLFYWGFMKERWTNAALRTPSVD